MMTALRINNFRSLKKLEVGDLTRVSLLVGANNAGKTSVLEAAELVLGGTGSAIVARGPIRRGETISIQDIDAVNRRYIEVGHLFNGHVLDFHSSFRIEADAHGPRFLSCKIVPIVEGELSLPESTSMVETMELEPSHALSIQGDRTGERPLLIPMTEQDAVSVSALRRIGLPEKLEGGWNVGFVETATPTAMQMRALWDRVVLTPEEAKVTEVLRVIEPDIERVAALSGLGGGAEGGCLSN